MKTWTLVAVALLLPGAIAAETGLNKKRALPQDFGRVILLSRKAAPTMPAVRFDHWLHRAKFTCRLCHVEMGFAMRWNATGITAEDNAKGYFCGACHNGKIYHGDRAIFPSCGAKHSKQDVNAVCTRCHSVGESYTPQYDFHAFVRDLPRGRFGNGVDWEKAEESGKVLPVDYLEGVSFSRVRFELPKDFDVSANIESMPGIQFSHRKHTIWSGCEGCHPDIFGVKKGTTKYTMREIFDGAYCGQCHKNVAFPALDCQRCHTRPVQ